MNAPIYLDYNASAPLDPRVREAMAPYWGDLFGNSRSGHGFGVQSKQAVERARAQVASFLRCESDEVLFTSGGSEANNLALKGLAWAVPARTHLVLSALEHYSVAYAADFLATQGRTLTTLGVDGEGRLDLGALDAALTDETLLVAVQHANNEVGTLQDVRAVAERAHARGALVHCDAAQSAGKLAVHVDALGCDLLTIAGHKFCGPQGVGALYRRRGVPLVPLVHGAGHEDGLRSGTHSVALIVGLGEACAIAERELEATTARLRALHDRLYGQLQARVPQVHLNGHPSERLPHTLNVSFPGLFGQEVLERAGLVAATTGAACHSGRREPSHAMRAMGVPEAVGLGALRLSLGRFTTEAEIDRAAEAVATAALGLYAEA